MSGDHELVGDGERRAATVLACDPGRILASGSGRATSSDPFLEFFREVVRRYDGYAERHPGGPAIGYFGAPTAHTDDPLRAVRAALELRSTIAELDPAIRPRTGIASGTVTMSRSQISGAPVAEAIRLSATAKADEILICDDTHRVVEDHVFARGTLSLAPGDSGPGPRVWNVRSMRVRAARRAAPMIGRDPEWNQLVDLLSRCAQQRRGGVAYIHGEAGMGKTRLVEELTRVARSRGFGCHAGLVLDFGDGRGQAPIAELARSLLGIRRNGTVEERRAILAPLEERAALGPLLGLESSDAGGRGSVELPHAERRAEQHRALAAIVGRRAESRPQLLVIEDVHWAEVEALGFVHHLAGAIVTSPVLLVLTSRTKESLAALPALADPSTPVARIELRSLAASAAETLARTLMKTTNEQLVRSCVERSEGHPLFLEQLIRNLDHGSRGLLPGSIGSVILARLDELAPANRRAVLAASVLGQRFTADALRHVLADPGYDPAPLVERSWVRPTDDALLFEHAFVLEATYATLSDEARRDLHTRAASWFADDHADADHRDPARRAEHLDRALHPGAPEAYAGAADSMLAALRFEEALRLAQRGLELLAAAAAQARDPALQYTLLLAAGEAHNRLGAPADALTRFREAAAVAPDEPRRCRAWLQTAFMLRLVDGVDEAMTLLDEARVLAERHRLAEELAAIAYLRGSLLFPRGDFKGCFAAHEEALRHAQVAGSAEYETRALSGLSDAYYLRGQIHTSMRYGMRCIELCDEHDMRWLAASSLAGVSAMHFFMGDLDANERVGARALEVAARTGNRRAAIVARIVRSWGYAERGDYERAAADLEWLVDAAVQLEATRFQAFGAIFLARVRLLQGRADEATAIVERSLPVARETGFGLVGPVGLCVLARAGSVGEALARRRVEALQSLTSALTHSHMFVHRDAIDLCIDDGDLDGIETHARALAAYTAEEPTEWSTLVITRARSVARHLQGDPDPALTAILAELGERLSALGLLPLRARVDAVLRERGV